MSAMVKMIHRWAWVVMILFLVIGIVYPVIGIAALLCMLAPVGFAFIRGRFWCGHFCPRGSFLDNILSKWSLKRKSPDIFRKTWFRNLFLLVLMSGFGVQLVMVWGNPTAVGNVFIRMIIATTLLAIILGFFYNQRIWCLICPMGTLAQYVSKGEGSRARAGRIVFQKDTCVDCKVCSKKCPVFIDVHGYKKQGEVLNPDCLKCQVCVDNCPKKALSFCR